MKHRLQFKNYFTESKVTDMQRHMLEEIIQNLINNNKEWFEEKHIYVGDKKDFWILNYQDIGRNEYNKLVRGLVVRKPYLGFNGPLISLISSFPFTRFFNHKEKDAAAVDISNAHMIEKLDGSMVAVHFPDGDPQKPAFHTRRMHSLNPQDMLLKQKSFTSKEESFFLRVIEKYVNQLNFTKEDVNNTYIFEFIHKISEVVTKYNSDQYGLYLIGGRNLNTFSEYSEEELNEIAKRIGCRRPKLFSTINHLNDIQKMFKIASEETPDFEGFIFRDKNTGNRVKVKDPEYLKKHRVIDNISFENLIPLYFQGETDEIVSYFPHSKNIVDQIDIAVKDYLNSIQEKVVHYKKMNLSRKDLSSYFYPKTVGERYKKEKIPPKIQEKSFNANFILRFSSDDNYELDYLKSDNFKNDLFQFLKNGLLEKKDITIYSLMSILGLES